MKKIILACILIGLSTVSIAHNSMETNAETGFFPNAWTSKNSKDFVIVEDSTNHYNVQITVNPVSDEAPEAQTGITVKDCYNKGSITQVRPGSTLICSLRPSISFSSNSDTKSASGDYQVE